MLGMESPHSIKAPVPYPRRLRAQPPHPSPRPLLPPQEIFLHDIILKSLLPHLAWPNTTGRGGAGLSWGGKVQRALTLPAVPTLVPLGQAVAQDGHEQRDSPTQRIRPKVLMESSPAETHSLHPAAQSPSHSPGLNRCTLFKFPLLHLTAIKMTVPYESGSRPGGQWLGLCLPMQGCGFDPG